MEETSCIFKTKKSRCKSTPRMDLPLLICQYHLKHYYGLELGYIEIDDVSHVGFAGGFLKPIKGFSVFSRNEVIIPTKKFLDLFLRPSDVQSNEDESKIKNFFLNKRIENYILEYGSSYPDSMDSRHPIEMYRNFIGNEIIDSDPKYKDYYPKLQAAVESSKTQSAVFIRNQPVMKAMENDFLYVKEGNKDEEIKVLNKDKFSLNFSYLLANCLYSEMDIDYSSKSYMDRLHFNTIFINDVGLVATEQIADPMYLILDGRKSGNQMFYQAHVGLLQKQVYDVKYSVKDIPKQYILNEAWKGGQLC